MVKKKNEVKIKKIITLKFLKMTNVTYETAKKIREYKKVFSFIGDVNLCYDITEQEHDKLVKENRWYSDAHFLTQTRNKINKNPYPAPSFNECIHLMNSIAKSVHGHIHTNTTLVVTEEIS